VRAGILPKPDLVLFIDGGMPFFPRGLEELDCPTVGYLIDVHTVFWVRRNYAWFFDHIFVAHKDYVRRFTDLGLDSVHWLPVACDPEIHGRIECDRDYDIGFVGSLEQSAERKRLIFALNERYKMNDFRRHYPKEELTKIYSRSKIVFNYAINKDVNMRIFEALAAGALLITNRIENGMSDLFRAGEHFVEYTDERSLFEQVDYYLTHDTERQRIAEAGMHATLARHTYDDRCRTMLEMVATRPDFRGAKVRTMSGSELRIVYGRIYSTFQLADAMFDEFDAAWQAKQGRIAAAKALGIALLKRVNASVMLTQRLRQRFGLVKKRP
jgi:hypothetical protein